VHGKGGKVRYLPLHPETAELVTDYFEAAGHGEDLDGALFRPVKNNTGGTVEGAITADGIYKMVKHYAKRVGVNIKGFGAHSLRATAVTNALNYSANITNECRSGSYMLTSLPYGSMTGRRLDQRTVRRLKLRYCSG
jgi:integrase/recombinase XerD